MDGMKKEWKTIKTCFRPFSRLLIINLDGLVDGSGGDDDDEKYL